MRVVAFIRAPKSPLGALGLGYGRIEVALAARGHTFEVIMPNDVPWVRALPFRAQVFMFPVAAALKLWRQTGTVDLAIFHSHAGWIFNLWKRGLPTITVFHGLEPHEYDALSKEMRRQGRTLTLRYRFTYGFLMPWWLRLSCRRSNRVLSLNSAETRTIVDLGLAAPEKVTQITHGVPPEGFVRNRAYAPVAKRLLMVSQWHTRKGIDYIAEAFATLVREGRDLELRCVGTRVPADVVRQSFPEDVRARVSVVADVPNAELLPEYRQADIFVHTALMEGMSRAQAEAAAAALPIVTTRCGAVGIDLLTDGESGCFVPMRHAAALAGAIRSLIDDPATRTRLGQAAAAIAERHLHLEPTLADLVSVYEAVAAERRPT